MLAERPDNDYSLTVSGYDEDPRDLWEIPEARAYIAEFCRAAGFEGSSLSEPPPPGFPPSVAVFTLADGTKANIASTSVEMFCRCTTVHVPEQGQVIKVQDGQHRLAMFDKDNWKN